MPRLHAVVIIVLDAILQQSLAFALAADDYGVETFTSWQEAKDALRSSLCVIVDQDIVQSHPGAWDGLIGPSNRVVLLADHMAVPNPFDALVLTKPLTGSDVLAAVGKFRADATALNTSAAAQS